MDAATNTSPVFENPLTSGPGEFASFLPKEKKEKLAAFNLKLGELSSMVFRPQKEHYTLDEAGPIRLKVAKGSFGAAYGCPEWNDAWIGHIFRPWPKEERLAPARTNLADLTQAPMANLSDDLPIVLTPDKVSKLQIIDQRLEEHTQSAVLKPSRIYRKFPPHIESHNLAVSVYEHRITDWADTQLSRNELFKKIAGCTVGDQMGQKPMLAKLEDLGLTKKDCGDHLAVEIVRATMSRLTHQISTPEFYRFLEKSKQAFSQYVDQKKEGSQEAKEAFNTYLDQVRISVQEKIMGRLLKSCGKKLQALEVETHLTPFIYQMSNLMRLAHTIGIEFVNDLAILKEQNPDTSLVDLVKRIGEAKSFYRKAYDTCEEMLNEHYEAWKDDPQFDDLKLAFQEHGEKYREYCDYATKNLGNIPNQCIVKGTTERKMGNQMVSIPSMIMDKEMLKLFSYVELPEKLQEADDGDWSGQEGEELAAPLSHKLGGMQIDDEEEPAIVNVTDSITVENAEDYPDELVFSDDDDPIINVTTSSAVKKESSIVEVTSGDTLPANAPDELGYEGGAE